jgi:hypothetical protein
MDVKSFCDSLDDELTGWKAKLNDTMKRLDMMPSGSREKVVPAVNDLHTIVEQLDTRIDRLRKECPAQWEPDKLELEQWMNMLRTKWGRIEDSLGV